MPQDEILIDPLPGDRDNQSKPFQIESADVRGRTVRFGTVAQQIIEAHDYPDEVSKILGEIIALVGLLGSFLKSAGAITIQAKADGAISMLVADYVSSKEGLVGDVRGYAQFDAEKVAACVKEHEMDPAPEVGDGEEKTLSYLQKLLGNGYLALTINQGHENEQYQGIVDLVGDDIAACAENYFLNSEQTPTALRLAAEKNQHTGHWRVGGIMIQHLSRVEEGRERLSVSESSENWNRARILMKSVKDDELINPSLEIDELLYRLFHEEGVRVFDAIALRRGCRCSMEKLEGIVRNFPKEDIKDMLVEGHIEMTCEFCNKVFKIEPEHL